MPSKHGDDEKPAVEDESEREKSKTNRSKSVEKRRRSRSRSKRRSKSKSRSKRSKSRTKRSRSRRRSKSRDRDRRRSRSRGDRRRDDRRRSRSRDDRRRGERDRSRDRYRRRSRSRDRNRRTRSRDRRDREYRRDGRRERTPEKGQTPPQPEFLLDAFSNANQQAASRNFVDLLNQGSSNNQNSMELMGSNSMDGSQDGNQDGRNRRKKSRWAGTDNDKTFIPGMPTILPAGMTPDQQQAYLVQLQIEEISRKLRTGDLGIAPNPEERSPSPEPIYSSDGKRLNTREFRTRKRLEEQRHQLILRMQCMNPEFKPPSDYKPPVIRVSDKVLIPQEEHPDINFVGLLIGPRGNTLKAMEKDTGAKIIIRGKGSVKEGKVGRKDGQPLPGEDEPLHAFITAANPECVKKAVDKIKEVIRQGIEVPEGHNDLRRMQLRELAQLNGTLRESDGPRCNNCGSTEHKSWLCPDKPNITNNIVCSACGGAGHIAKDCRSKRPGAGGVPAVGAQAKIDEEYMSLMAELGEGPEPNESMPTISNTPRSNFSNLFDKPAFPPRPIMPPQQQQAPAPPMPPQSWPPMPTPPPLMSNPPVPGLMPTAPSHCPPPPAPPSFWPPGLPPGMPSLALPPPPPPPSQ